MWAGSRAYSGVETGMSGNFLSGNKGVKDPLEVPKVRCIATPWTAAHQAPPSMGFSKQEYWSGVP